jgi:hypothetical protein
MATNSPPESLVDVAAISFDCAWRGLFLSHTWCVLATSDVTGSSFCVRKAPVNAHKARRIDSLLSDLTQLDGMAVYSSNHAFWRLIDFSRVNKHQVTPRTPGAMLSRLGCEITAARQTLVRRC